MRFNLDQVLGVFADIFGKLFRTLNTVGSFPQLFGKSVSLYTLLFSMFIISVFVNAWWRGAKG